MVERERSKEREREERRDNEQLYKILTKRYREQHPPERGFSMYCRQCLLTFTVRPIAPEASPAAAEVSSNRIDALGGLVDTHVSASHALVYVICTLSTCRERERERESNYSHTSYNGYDKGVVKRVFVPVYPG